MSLGYVQSWNIGWQRELGRDSVVEFRYTGNHGVHLWRQYNLNEVNIFENGFLKEFQVAQNNLRIARGGDITKNTTVNNWGNTGLAGPGGHAHASDRDRQHDRFLAGCPTAARTGRRRGQCHRHQLRAYGESDRGHLHRLRRQAVPGESLRGQSDGRQRRRLSSKPTTARRSTTRCRSRCAVA